MKFRPNLSGDPAEGDWNEPQLAVSSEGLAESLGTEIENAFDGDRDLNCGAEQTKMELLGLSDTAWSGSGGGEGSGEAANIEAYIAEQSTLSDYLGAQLAVATGDPVERMIGLAIIDSIDEAGYLRESAEEIADRLGAAPQRVEKIIAVVPDLRADRHWRARSGRVPGASSCANSTATIRPCRR